MARIRLKICIASLEEARLAIEAGADAVGFGDAMPLVADAEIAWIARGIPPPVAGVLLSSALTAGAIAAQADLSGANTVQVMRPVDPAEYPGMRRILRGRKFIQVVAVEGPQSVATACDYAKLADALLLEEAEPGSGPALDWGIGRRIVEESGVPVFLAGGLDPGNVAEAVAAVRPWGVDAGWGLRSAERLDPTRLAAFTRALWG